ncbi:hypothetical protein GCM10022243_00210 [Saccharothrix violaceirubra]
MPQGQHGLDHARDARRGLGVPDVGLDRAQPQRLGARLAVGRQQGLRLDRVAERGAGAVRLDVVHVGRLQARERQRPPDHPFLRRTVGRGQTVGRAVLVHGGRPHHREHPVTVAARVGKPFQQQESGALAPARAVGRVREGLDPPVRGQPALPGELHEPGGRGHDRDAAGQRERALPRAQGLRREVDRHQRRRTRRVDRHRRALQAEQVGHPA